MMEQLALSVCRDTFYKNIYVINAPIIIVWNAQVILFATFGNIDIIKEKY
jgi:hypothetical protein